MELIGTKYFSGQRNIAPSPDASDRDLAVLIRELQTAANAAAAATGKVANNYVGIDDTDTPFTPEAGQNLIGVDTTTAAVTVVLPDASSLPAGSEMVINDEGGNAGTNAITADGNVDGSDDPTISTDSGSLTLYTNGTAWFTK